jgi:hypothetical protein
MSQDNESRPQPQPRPASSPPMEQRGIVDQVIVPIAAAGTAGAVNAVVSNLLKKDK